MSDMIYGSQACCYSEKNAESIAIALNKTVRDIWNLPFDSPRAILCGLNTGLHV